ncbi:PQQ-binding-like beta-propeller repeat protein [Mycobacterium simiae]|uniref:PQQ-binding-like beta-propeller repeat protein n=1 Tax=Mycobacterium simiae TaxID=1784 RepID=A0A5B1BVP9_MYCSI|nr:PQQ-binding-like beta-propeller repeat protein [Mycobacterium simiae]KAA1251423.1 PQQ-binding-like beta-propeller repeat protein [Mycobacterium simiae]
MVKPERRTKGDIVAAAAIAVAVVLAVALIWWTSDARATISRPAATPAPNPTPAREVPAALKQLWTAHSPATRVPVVAGGTVATGDGRRVEGRDPATGETLWSYSRDTDLCGVTWVYRYAVAVYRDDRGCGQVSTIDGSTGRRGPARSSYADPSVLLSSDGTTVLSAGNTRLELWRSDMVRMLSYGETDARVKPSNRGLHSGCTLESAAASSSAVSVLEACNNQADLRLVLLHPGKEEDEPEQRIVPEPGNRPGSGARVLVVSQNTTAVYLPGASGAQPRVDVIDETGTTVASTLLAKAPSPAATVSQTGNLVTWWTGDALMVFDTGKLTQRYTIAAGATAAPLGPGVMMAGQLLVPVTGAIGVYDPVNGENKGYLAVDRPPSTLGSGKAVIPVVSGSEVIEQRGDTVVALG